MRSFGPLFRPAWLKAGAIGAVCIAMSVVVFAMGDADGTASQVQGPVAEAPVRTLRDPIVSVWYRGNPAGTPLQSELGAIRALGFNGVTWPKTFDKTEAELRRLAELVGLVVEVVDKPNLAGPSSTLTPGNRVDLVVTPDGRTIPALAWRAVAHGARTIAFDAGERVGAGLDEKNGSLKPWARAAIALARQLTANSRLVRILKPGPGILLTPPQTPALDVVMLDGDRSWVVVATNTSAQPLTASARLPAGAPYAMWVSWIDGSTLAMQDEPPGPRWNLQIAPWTARVYLVDKVLKLDRSSAGFSPPTTWPRFSPPTTSSR